MSEKFKPEIVVLYCQQSLDPATDVTAARGLARECVPRFVAMPCSSKAEVSHLMRVLEDGADGVLVAACPDRACRFMVGNMRAEKRIGRVRELLDAAGLGAERAALVRGSGLSAARFAELADERALAVRPLGTNPIKGNR